MPSPIEDIPKIKPINLPELKPIETESVTKRQSLKEWGMTGGGVPHQYRGREHIWHAKVKKFAAGGEVYNTNPDMSDGGEIIQGPAFARGGEVHMADGGAAFGVFPQMKGKRSKQDREASKNVPIDLARGVVAGALGAPGDIESLVRMLPGLDERTFLPTSGEIEKRLPFRSELPVSRAASGLGTLAGGFYTGPGSPLRAVTALPKAVKRAGQDFAVAAGQPATKIFAGPVSKTWDSERAHKAVMMEQAGAKPEQIWLETGTFRGPEGKWRQEIDDSKAVHRFPAEIQAKAQDLKGQQVALKEAAKQSLARGKEVVSDLFPKEAVAARQALKKQVGNIDEELGGYYGLNADPQRGNLMKYGYQHPDLYAAYPELAEYILKQGNNGSRGAIGSLDGRDVNLYILGLIQKNPGSTLAHEMQHAVQKLEGTPRGGNPEEFARARYDAELTIQGQNDSLSYLAKKIDEAADPTVKAELRKDYEKLLEQRNLVVPYVQIDPYQEYRLLGGEAEARAVQKRLDMTPEERAKTFPLDSYDEDIAKLRLLGQNEQLNIFKAEGGAVQHFDGGGMAAADFAGPEEGAGSLEKAKLMTKLLADMAKQQGSKEVDSLKKPRAVTDLLNRGVLANNPLSAGVDLFNMGLGAVGMGSEKPFLGSEHVKDLMDKYNVTSGEDRPMMETALSFASPTAMIKGAMKAPGAAKKVTDALTSSKIPPLATEAKTAQAGKPTGATYATRQEGPFYRVIPSALDQSTVGARGVREAAELQGQGAVGAGPSSTGQRIPKQFSDEEVAGLINAPTNKARKLAQDYTKEQHGSDFAMPEMPASSLAKQSAIGRTHMAAVESSPAYKNAIFDAYTQSMPEVLEKAGAKNYDDLLEKAYRQLAKETSDQFDRLPVSMSFHKSGEGNYKGAKEMAADVHGNDHLYVFQGGDRHDFLNQVDPHTGLNENEKFRAVHDLFGHAIHGNEFGPAGEEKAWGIHKQMYSPLAQLAMTAETRGQNSVVNYTPLNAKLKAEVAQLREVQMEAKRRGDTQGYNMATKGIEDAPQKAILLPPEYLSAEYKGGMPDYVRKLITPEKGTETQSVLTHYSHSPELKFTDPTRYGTGIKGAEAERLSDPSAVRDRSYFYMGEPGAVPPEPGLGVHRYRGESSNLYDITQDPLDFRVLARESNRTPFTAKYNKGITHPLQDANDMERLVREYGYQGMANPKASKPMAIMFDQTPVQRHKRGGLSSIK